MEQIERQSLVQILVLIQTKKAGIVTVAQYDHSCYILIFPDASTSVLFPVKHSRPFNKRVYVTFRMNENFAIASCFQIIG